MKLTKPQLTLLAEVSEVQRFVCDYYAPAKALVAKGLCKWDGNLLKITPEGLEFLKKGNV